MTAPIVFTAAGVLLTHGPLRPLRVNPSEEVVKVLAEATLALVLFSDASRIGLRHLRADQGLCLQRLDSAPSRRHWQEERCPRPAWPKPISRGCGTSFSSTAPNATAV